MTTLPDESPVAQAARKPASKIGTLRDLLFALLQEHERDGLLPTSARFLFYELVTRGQYSKVATGARRADQDLIDALKRLRDEGRVPWEWITDETRSVEDYTGYRTIKEGVLTTLPGIGLNPWHYSPPLILTESRSLAGMLRAVASEYRVRIASTNGQVGGFLHTEVVPLLQAADTVGYLGDYDLAGGQIEANTQRVLERKIGGGLNWERIALTAQQVRQYSLPSITKSDRRYNDGHSHEAVETEAIKQTVLIRILRAWLEMRLPEPLARVQEREARQRRRHGVGTTRSEVGPSLERIAYTITEFCFRNSISRPTYHRLRSQGLGPTEMRIGLNLIRITADAEREWQHRLQRPRRDFEAMAVERAVSARHATAQRDGGPR